MAFTTSPNMNLIIPAVGNEQGPNYAFDINASLALIDQHDHSTGKGVQITPAGININSALTFNNNLATALSGIVFSAQGSANSTINSISVAPGSGVSATDLFFTDGSGNVIQITKSGAVNVVASSIPGETYASGTFIWTQDQSSLPTTPANFDIGSITIRPNVAATTNGVTVSPPTAIASHFTINLPQPVTAGPLMPNFVTMNASGVQQNIYNIDDATLNLSGNNIQVAPQGITTTQIANQAVTATQIANATITTTQIAANAGIIPSQTLSNSSGNFYKTQSFSTTSLTSSPTTIATVSGGTSFTTNRPTFLQGRSYITFTLSGTIGTTTLVVSWMSGANTVQTWSLSFVNNSGQQMGYAIPLSAFNMTDFNFNGASSYFLQASISGHVVSASINAGNIDMFQV